MFAQGRGGTTCGWVAFETSSESKKLSFQLRGHHAIQGEGRAPHALAAAIATARGFAKPLRQNTESIWGPSTLFSQQRNWEGHLYPLSDENEPATLAPHLPFPPQMNMDIPVDTAVAHRPVPISGITGWPDPGACFFPGAEIGPERWGTSCQTGQTGGNLCLGPNDVLPATQMNDIQL